MSAELDARERAKDVAFHSNRRLRNILARWGVHVVPPELVNELERRDDGMLAIALELAKALFAEMQDAPTVPAPSRHAKHVDEHGVPAHWLDDADTQPGFTRRPPRG